MFSHGKQYWVRWMACKASGVSSLTWPLQRALLSNKICMYVIVTAVVFHDVLIFCPFHNDLGCTKIHIYTHELTALLQFIINLLHPTWWHHIMLISWLPQMVKSKTKDCTSLLSFALSFRKIYLFVKYLCLK